MADVNCDERRDLRPLHMLLTHERLLREHPHGVAVGDIHRIMKEVLWDDTRLQGQAMMNHTTMCLMLKSHGLVDIHRRADQAHYLPAFLKEDLLVPVRPPEVESLDQIVDEVVSLEDEVASLALTVDTLNAQVRERDGLLEVAERIIRGLTKAMSGESREAFLTIGRSELYDMVDTLKAAEGLDYASVMRSNLVLEYASEGEVMITVKV